MDSRHTTRNILALLLVSIAILGGVDWYITTHQTARESLLQSQATVGTTIGKELKAAPSQVSEVAMKTREAVTEAEDKLTTKLDERFAERMRVQNARLQNRMLEVEAAHRAQSEQMGALQVELEKTRRELAATRACVPSDYR